ncbi:hypothetical protein C9I50_21650 [Pseudomonas prosekii]|nr:hypothetical protein C9I50_21650 [Pseudomonas prosekii]
MTGVLGVVVRASSRASPLPPLIFSEHKIRAGRRSLVGASLLAIATCQAPHQQRPIIIGFTRRPFPTVTAIDECV